MDVPVTGNASQCVKFELPLLARPVTGNAWGGNVGALQGEPGLQMPFVIEIGQVKPLCIVTI